MRKLQEPKLSRRIRLFRVRQHLSRLVELTGVMEGVCVGEVERHGVNFNVVDCWVGDLPRVDSQNEAAITPPSNQTAHIVL